MFESMTEQESRESILESVKAFGYQLVLYLEGAKLFEPFFVFAAQRILRSFHYE